MRTTLTIDADVAVQLKRLMRERDASLKELVNDTLRRGLQADARPKPRKPYRIKTYDMGQALVDIDNVAEAIAAIEGENYK
jgi:hypothetical protein